MNKFWSAVGLGLDIFLELLWRIVVFIFIICWLWHVEEVAETTHEVADAQLIVDIAGVFFPPLGAFMGWPF